MNQSHIFKLIIAGDAKVGKTTFINRHRTGEFKAAYTPTMGVEVHPLTFSTNQGNVILNCWDCAGDEKLGGLREGYYIGAKAAIVMFDVTNQPSYENVDKYVNKLREKCPNIPIVLCGNKVDCTGRKVRPSKIYKHTLLELTDYYDVSAKSNYNFEKPFLTLLRSLINNNVHFTVEV